MDIKAWVVAFITAFSSFARTAAGAEPGLLISFEAADSADAWISVNDGVMGGVSKGGFERSDKGTLLFAGELSLENRGGFASIRTKPRDMDLSGLSAIEVKAKGDGRTYWMELRVSGQMGASSYRADLATTAGEWKTTRIPLDAFQLQAFGQTLPGKVTDLSRVNSVGFTLADKKAGDFELEIEYVKGVQRPGAVEPENGKGGTLVDVATAAGGFKTLLAAATAADLAGTLSGGGPFTVFAPTDQAFAKLPPGTVDELCKPANREKLAGILKYHVLPGRVTLAKALEAREGVTLQGGKVTVKFEKGVVRVGPATLVEADVSASNGIIHVIDRVLLPPDSVGEPLPPGELIERAIDRGVPLFNEGQHAACAAVYEIACEALRAMPGVSGESRQDLSRALKDMREEKSARQQAWILRLALDRTADRLDEGK